MSQSLSSTKPALTPPPGVPAEFYNPYTLFPYEALTIVASIIVTTILVWARLYTKKFIVKAMKWEDYTCLFGWMTFVVWALFEYVIGVHGGGTHQWNLFTSSLEYQRRYTNISDPIYSLSLFFTKCSILLLILRVFCSTHRDIPYWLTVGLILVNAIFYTVFFFVPIFLCSPRTKIWVAETTGKCLKINALYLSSASFNMISDIAMLSVPVYLIWNLQMSVQRKIGVSSVFATGGLACIASIARLTFHVLLARTKDYSYVKSQTALWAVAEIAFGLICSCLVVLPRLFPHLTSITPRNGNTAARATETSVPHLSKKNWIRMTKPDGQSLKTPSSHAWRKGRNGSDELESAVEGKPVDVEEGL